MLILTRDTLRNPAVLETKALPRKFFGRVSLAPRNPSLGLRLRLLLEFQFLRYLAALIPFCIPMFVWRESAAPISQAPLAMVLLIAFVELRVLGLSDRARHRLMSEDAARAILDTLDFRGRAALRDIAARHGIEEGELRLVIEHSTLARVPPLTLVTVQSAVPKPHVLDLDAQDRARLTSIFDDTVTERHVHRASLRLNEPLHQVTIETRGVSAHARLAARLAKGRQAAAPEKAPA